MNIRNTKPLLPARGSIMLSPRTIFLALGRRMVKSCSDWTFVILLLMPMLAFSHGDTPFSATDVIHACRSPFAGVLRKINTGDCQPTEAVVHWNVVGPQGVAGPPGPAGAPGGATESNVEWDIAAAASTAVAASYCLANHSWTSGVPLFVSPEHPGGFTASGYELPTIPIVGAVRRNFIRNRAPDDISGNSQNCSQACARFMSGYAPSYRGVALHRRYNSGTVETDGLNDLGGLVAGTSYDTDFYRADRSKKIIAGIHARVDGYLEADVAQADNCCCGLAPP